MGPAFGTWRLVIDSMMATGMVLVARPTESDTDMVLGWACTNKMAEGKDVLHYVYVRDTHRGLGIAKQLLQLYWLDDKTHLVPGKFDALRYVGYRP